VSAPALSLGRVSARGSLTLLLANALQLALAVGATMILARLLAPADFGRFALASVVLGLSGPLRDFGLPFALVHHELPDARTLDGLFAVNLWLTVLLSLSAWLSAVPFARFFDDPAIIGPIHLFALLLLVRGSANVQSGLLARRMAYGTMAVVSTVSVACGAFAGIAMALGGAKLEALLVQIGVTWVAETILLWVLADWRPGRQCLRLSLEVATLQQWLSYGRNLSASRIVGEGVAQVDRLLVGRLGGATALGYYQSALRWVTLPLQQLLKPVKTVVVSSLSRLHGQPDRYAHFASQAIGLTASLVLPMFTFLAVMSDGIILVLLGEQWQASVAPFRILCLAMMLESVDRVSNWICLAEGRTARRLRWTIWSAPLMIVGMFLGSQWDWPAAVSSRLASSGVATSVIVDGAVDGGVAKVVSGVAAGVVAARLILLVPGWNYCLKGSVLSPSRLVRGVLRPMVATSVATLALLLLARHADRCRLDARLELPLGGVLFALIYGLIWIIQPGGRSLALSWWSTFRGEQIAERTPHG